MGHSNLLVFACKPAPIQVTALCSMGTTGLSTMDYRISDQHSDPLNFNDAFYTEKTIRLPDGYFCHEPPTDAPPVERLPALTNGYVTFGSLNNFTKVNPQVLTVWAEILNAVLDSRLMLRCPEGNTRQRVRDLMAATGIKDHRLEFLGGMLSQDAYYHLHDRMDLYLDPFPYASHTTGLDALWMGVPLITLAGRRDVGRSGVFLMTNVGLPECICQTPRQYVELAITLAHDLPRLAAIRSTLRQRVQQSPLVDGARYTRHVEAAYREMWRTWCATAPRP
jgi:protein O-GlcNAc transferase